MVEAKTQFTFVELLAISNALTHRIGTLKVERESESNLIAKMNLTDSIDFDQSVKDKINGQIATWKSI